MGVKEILIERAKNKGFEECAQLERVKAEEKTHALVEKLIVKSGMSDEQVADFAEVSLDFVRKVRSDLKVLGNSDN